MKSKDIIKDIRKHVFSLCKGSGWEWEKHILSVVRYSKMLAKKLGADKEICEMSALLHDIKKIKGEKKDHHITGSKEAENILKSYGYPKDKIDKVKDCILTHSSDKKYAPKSVEAKIVYCADALSHFDNFLSLAQYLFIIKKMDVEECRKRLIKKFKKSYKKIILKEAKQIADPKYEAIKIILKKS